MPGDAPGGTKDKGKRQPGSFLKGKQYRKGKAMGQRRWSFKEEKVHGGGKQAAFSVRGGNTRIHSASSQIKNEGIRYYRKSPEMIPPAALV